MKKLIFGLFAVALLAAAYIGWNVKNRITGASVTKSTVVYISSDATFDDVIKQLKNCKCIKDIDHFIQVAGWKKYPDLLKPGRYELMEGMSNEEAINKLRIGDQDPVKVTFNNVRTMEQLAGKVSKYFEADSLAFVEYLTKPELPQQYGFNAFQFSSMFIPNTYVLHWNTSPEKFCKRMATEYKRFWSNDRIQKARKLKMSQSEIVTLASIVEEETKLNDEKPIVAGVYWNRLERGMLLQADPTVVYAANDFTIRRVLNKHKKIDSPYNTYMYKGLPPGPIRFPEISSVNAVLNLQKHQYLYFCASPDFSGHHLFASNYKEHKKNARRFHTALNERNIYR